MTETHLILGGARSGKSTYAEQVALQLAGDKNIVRYIATATADDAEMSERIEHHQLRRGPQWRLIEEPIKLAERITQIDKNSTVLIDCLTLWLSNCLHGDCWPEQRDALINAVEMTQANVIMVSNEVGSGIVPMGELSRQFVDHSGWLHQAVAEICDSVTLVVAGLPMPLKRPSSKDHERGSHALDDEKTRGQNK